MPIGWVGFVTLLCSSSGTCGFSSNALSGFKISSFFFFDTIVLMRPPFLCGKKQVVKRKPLGTEIGRRESKTSSPLKK